MATKPAEPRVVRISVTPSMAEKWLARNTHNRNLRPVSVDRYARAMSAGKWQNSPDAIMFVGDRDDPQSTLTNGQHRLAAIVKANVAVTLLVMDRCTWADQEETDHGMKRSLSDVLKLRGERNTTALGAFLVLATRWIDTGSTLGKGGGNSDVYSYGDYLTVLEGDRDLIMDAMSKGRYVYFNAHRIGTPPAYTFLSWLVMLESEHKDRLNDFLNELALGENIADGDVAFAYRRRAANLKNNARAVVRSDIECGVLVKAWGLWLNDIPTGYLTWKSHGKGREDFPVMI